MKRGVPVGETIFCSLLQIAAQRGIAERYAQLLVLEGFLAPWPS